MSKQYNIADYIPQRPPFIFIDTIEEVNETLARTCFTIPADYAMVTDGHLTLAGLAENAAQTCAVRIGYMAGNKIGYIGAIKQMGTRSLPRVGQTLTTEVRLIQEVLNICMMECVTSVDGEIVATATLKLATVD